MKTAKELINRRFTRILPTLDFILGFFEKGIALVIFCIKLMTTIGSAMPIGSAIPVAFAYAPKRLLQPSFGAA